MFMTENTQNKYIPIDLKSNLCVVLINKGYIYFDYRPFGKMTSFTAFSWNLMKKAEENNWEK